MADYRKVGLGDTVYLAFASNSTSGSGNDGATAVAYVREQGTAAAAAPITTAAGTLLSHATFPAGCYEVSIVTTTGNGFAAGNHYAVYCTLAVSGENPVGYIGTVYIMSAGESEVLALHRALVGIPDATAGSNGGLPTVDGNNHINGVQDTLTVNLNTNQTTVTVGRVNTVADVTGSVATLTNKTGFSLAADQSAVTVGTVTTVTNPVDLKPDQGGVTVGTVTTATNAALASVWTSALATALGRWQVTTGTCAAASTSLIVKTTLTAPALNSYKGMTFLFTSGSGNPIARTITGNTTGANTQIYVSPALTTLPAEGDTFAIMLSADLLAAMTDDAGFGLGPQFATAAVLPVWDTAVADVLADGTTYMGGLVAAYLDAAVSTRATVTALTTAQADLTTLVARITTAPPTAAANAAAMLAATVDMPGTTDKTVSEVLQAAWAQAGGKWTLVGTTLTLYAPDGTTAVATFTVDSATDPTSRTPV